MFTLVTLPYSKLRRNACGMGTGCQAEYGLNRTVDFGGPPQAGSICTFSILDENYLNAML